MPAHAHLAAYVSPRAPYPQATAKARPRWWGGRRAARCGRLGAPEAGGSAHALLSASAQHARRHGRVCPAAAARAGIGRQGQGAKRAGVHTQLRTTGKTSCQSPTPSSRGPRMWLRLRAAPGAARPARPCSTRPPDRAHRRPRPAPPHHHRSPPRHRPCRAPAHVPAHAHPRAPGSRRRCP